MIAAFEEIGYDVYTIMGSGEERNNAFKQLKQMISEQKMVFEFAYSESSTQPTMIASGKRDLIKYLFLEYRIFRYLKKYDIPTALFYRDIHWQFDKLSKNRRSLIKYYIFLLFYRLDLQVYKRYITAVATPFYRMWEYVPAHFNKKFTLPAGSDKRTLPLHKSSKQKLNIFYVGGFGNLYSMHELCNAVLQSDGVSLTLCIRKEDWRRVKHEYPLLETSKEITIVHKSGDELTPYYHAADVLSFVLRPYEYLNITVPYKLYEYVSYGKPIMATKETGFADFIEKNDVGWSVDYTESAILELLNNLKKNQDEVEKKRENMIKIIPQNYWSERAKTVIGKVLK